MGLLDSLKSLFSKEAAEVKDSLATAERRANASLDAKERDLAASPEDKLASIQAEIDDGDDSLAAVRDKIERKTHLADADEEVRELADTEDEASPEEPEVDTPSAEPESTTTETDDAT